MMLYPPVQELVDKVGSRYLLVNLVARRAREISQTAEDEQETLDRKPISIAIDEVYTGKLKITEDGETAEGEEISEEEQEGETVEEE